MVGDMMKNGFTMVEFISILIVISTMTLVSAPLVSNELNNIKKAEAESKCNFAKQGLKLYFYENNKAVSLDLTDENVIESLGISDADIIEGQATIDNSGNITSEMKIDNFTCTISGNTEEISCS